MLAGSRVLDCISLSILILPVFPSFHVITNVSPRSKQAVNLGRIMVFRLIQSNSEAEPEDHYSA
jgi:hypothetical protein